MRVVSVGLAIRSFQAGQDANHEKRLAAVEELWTDVLHLRDKFSEVVLFYDILLPGEYDAVYKKGGALGAAISTVDEKFINDAMRPVEMLERQRPYLGETLWLRFFIYRAFFGRLAFLINDGKRRDHIQNWKEDSGVRQLLSPAISSEMLSSVLETKNPTTIRIAINALEAPMLEEISLIVSGRRSAFESFKNAKDLQASLAEVVEQRRL